MWSSTSRVRTNSIAHAIPALILASLLAVTTMSFAAEPKVHLNITKESARSISLAVTPFSTTEGKEEQELRSVLQNDLSLSGYFQLLEIGELQTRLFEIEKKSGSVNFATWASWGAELMVRVSYEIKGDDFSIKAFLYDVDSRKRMLGKKYSGRRGQGIRAIHVVTDDIIQTLTGERSLALTRIAFTNGSDGVKRIGVMNYDGRGTSLVSPAGTLALYPSWFPDGKRLAYVTYRFGRPEIVSHNLETGQVRSLAFFPGLNAFPDISADGRHMVFALSRDGNPEIYRMAVDGSELKRLTFSKAVEASPVWSPDGKQIAFISDQSGSPQIYTSSSSGGRARRISYTGHYSTSPAWSPLGDRIVFTSLTEGTFQLFTVDVASGENEQLTFDHGNKEDPSWAHNGRHLVFSQGRSSSYRIYIFDTYTGRKTAVSSRTGNDTSPAWSP